MTLYRPYGGWSVFNTEERYWFSRLLLESFFWNNHCDEEGMYTKYMPRETTRHLNTAVFGRFSQGLRDRIWWQILLAACYEEIKGEGAIIESGIAAIFEIIEDLLLAEIDWGIDILEEEDSIQDYYVRYRMLVESAYRTFFKDEETNSDPPTPEEVFRLDEEEFWSDRLESLSFVFKADDDDYKFGDLPPEKLAMFAIAPNYFSQKDLLQELLEKEDIGYWDLLMRCLKKEPLPSLEAVKQQKKELNWFESLEKHYNKKELEFLQELIITTSWNLT